MTRRGRTRMTPWRAGLLAIAVILAGCYVAFGGRLPWERDWEVQAVVKDAVNLGSRSPVRTAGVDVGKVKKVERGPGSTAIVTMAIDEHGLPLHEDAELKIKPRLFLEGNFYVDLRPGTPASPELERGGTIPLAQTAGPVQLDQILTSLTADTRGNLRRLLNALAGTFDRRGSRHARRLVPLLEPAFLETAVAAEAMRGEREGDIAGLIANGEQTARALASRRARLPRLVASLNRTLGTVAARRDELGRSVEELSELSVEAPATFRALNEIFPVTRVVAVEVRPALRAAPETLRLAHPVLTQAGELLAPDELPALLAELDPALRSLRTLERGLGELLPRLRPVTECLRRNAVPVLKSSVVDPPLTTGRPIYRELLSMLVGLASASQNFTGDGPALRYHAGFGDNMVSTGEAPSLGEPLVGLTEEPLLGSRPRPTATRPPLRPDVRCITQEPPNLDAETGPPPRQRSVP